MSIGTEAGKYHEHTPSKERQTRDHHYFGGKILHCTRKENSKTLIDFLLIIKKDY